jgi:hypothetical protein
MRFIGIFGNGGEEDGDSYDCLLPSDVLDEQFALLREDERAEAEKAEAEKAGKSAPEADLPGALAKETDDSEA